MNGPLRNQQPLERVALINEYIAHGWKLCEIPPGTKGPTSKGWNRPENALQGSPEGLQGVGLMHAYSQTMSLDIDSMKGAALWLFERGVNLEQLLDADDAVQIVSGNPDHAKLLYALPFPMQSKKIVVAKKAILEFRSGTANGLSVQDCLPPTVHPNGNGYQWAGKGNWKQLPVIPDALLAVWCDLLNKDAERNIPAGDKQPPANMNEVASALYAVSPDCSRQTWVECGMALATVDYGLFSLWDEWSQGSPKYPGQREAFKQWESFKPLPGGIGVGSLFFHAFAAGWQRPVPAGMFGPVPAPQPAVPASLSVQLVQASKVKPENINWLWKHWLAKGKIHICAGQPGTGKTTIALRIAAVVSNGGAFPDGFQCEAGNVLIWSGEDAVEDTLVPRLMAAGANRERIFFVSAIEGRNEGERISFDPAIHMPQLEQTAKKLGNVALLIVDSIADAIVGDSHKNSEVRRGLRPLADFGQQTGCAIFGIAHFNKGSGGKDPLERVMGSAAFGAVARIVYGCARIVENGVLVRRVFCRAKSNIGPDGDGFEYEIHQTTIEGGIEASKIEFGKPIAGTAKEILASPDEGGGNPDEGQKMTIAMNFLREILKDGPMNSGEVAKQAKDEFGITVATLRRAKEKLGVRSKQVGLREWEMELPAPLPDFPRVEQ